MKRMLIRVIVFIAFLTVACAPKAQGVIDEGMEMAREFESIAELSDEGTAPENSSEREFVSWDALNLPSRFPEYTDGRFEKPFIWDEQDWYPKLLGVEGSSIEAIETYILNAQDLGYSLQWEREVMGDEDLGWAIGLETDDARYSIIINYFEEENGIEDYVLLILDFREK